jgi:hypothetical protein
LKNNIIFPNNVCDIHQKKISKETIENLTLKLHDPTMILDRFVLKMAYLGLLVPTTNPDAINKLFASKHYTL